MTETEQTKKALLSASRAERALENLRENLSSLRDYSLEKETERVIQDYLPRIASYIRDAKKVAENNRRNWYKESLQ